MNPDGLLDGRYRLLLAQYNGKGGVPCKSCKDLFQQQIDDLRLDGNIQR